MPVSRRWFDAWSRQRREPLRFLPELLHIKWLLAGGNLRVGRNEDAVSRMSSEEKALRHALGNGPVEPTLHDLKWRTFCLEREANSRLAKENWSSFRRGLKRLEAAHSNRVPITPLRRVLAEDAFFCATHWGHGRAVVQRTLSELLEHRLGVSKFTFAAAEYWKWARRRSPRDSHLAEHMLSLARAELPNVDRLTRDNLNQMLRVEVDEAQRLADAKRS